MQLDRSALGAAPGSGGVLHRVAGLRRTTPGRLQLILAALLALALLTGLVSGLTAASAATGTADLGERAQPLLVEAETIYSALADADTTAAQAFLAGGLEPVALTRRYEADLDRATTALTSAARRTPESSRSADAIGRLSNDISRYAALVASARANNRQGLPVGAQYLRSASSQLRSETLPILDSLVSTNADRATDRMRVWPGWIFVVVALLALVAAVIAQVWLARRFRRTINVGMLAGSVVLLLALVGGAIAVLQLSGAVRSIQDGSFASVNAAAAARIDANNAKSNESLTLIARGSGAAFQTAWQSSSDAVLVNLDRLGGPLPDQWRSYVAVHNEIRKLDDGGQWDAAVALATASGPESANTVFNAFDASLADKLEQVNRAASSALSGQQPGLIVGAILLFAAGLGAALLGRRGVAVRLKEYR